MAEITKILAQSNPIAALLTDIYTVPVATSTVISTMKITNRSVVPTSFRISVAIAGAVDDLKQYIYYDQIILGNDTFSFTEGITLGVGDVLRIYATLATLSFNVFGVERT